MADQTVVRDSIYTFEIARRAVGRAALHLGIDSMTEQALDVMADVLLQYLTRTGKALSHLAESSRRTSAHVNVLDAFQACQLVASPAVERLHLQEPEEEEEDLMAASNPKPSDGVAASNGSSSNGNGGINSTAVSASAPSNGGTPQPSNHSSSQSSTGWKGLAAFVFGPNWLQEKDEEEVLMELAAAKATDAENGEGRDISSGGAGGKVFPSALENGDNGNGGSTSHTRRKRSRGWNAPYPDDVAPFPRASATCANPHALPAKLTGGLSFGAGSGTVYRKVDVDADEAIEDEREVIDELEALSDEVFLSHPKIDSKVATLGGSAWGSIDGKSKRKLDSSGPAATKDEDGDVDMQPATKKVKFGEGSKKSKKRDPKKDDEISILGGKTADDTLSAEEKFSYVPNFYPLPPSTEAVVDDRRTVIDGMDDRQQRLLQQQRTQQQQEQQIFASDAASEAGLASTSLRDTMNIDSSRGVRSSLIRLGNSYWGSGWDQAASTASAPTLAVPMGRKVGGPSAAGGAGGRAMPEDPIIPMSRASGSRVSRVLEGSMDAAAMQ